MAHEILSIKMYELDKKISWLRNRILMSESADHRQICEEIADLRTQCKESEMELQNKLQLSKPGMVHVLSEAYEEIGQIIKGTKEKLEAAEEDDSLADEKILFAEYSLDFAMQAVSQALLISMEALDAYMTQEEETHERN